jgi:hypothetical protein
MYAYIGEYHGLQYSGVPCVEDQTTYLNYPLFWGAHLNIGIVMPHDYSYPIMISLYVRWAFSQSKTKCLICFSFAIKNKMFNFV